jgi:hypothetical protein
MESIIGIVLLIFLLSMPFVSAIMMFGDRKQRRKYNIIFNLEVLITILLAITFYLI